MSARGTSASASLRAAVVLLFLVAIFGAAPVTATASPVAPVDHHLTADGHHDPLTFTEHAHIGLAATAGAPDVLGDVTAARARAVLIPLGLLSAAAFAWRLAPRHTPLVGRDPPRIADVVSPGRDVLARLCISRR